MVWATAPGISLPLLSSGTKVKLPPLLPTVFHDSLAKSAASMVSPVFRAVGTVPPLPSASICRAGASGVRCSSTCSAVIRIFAGALFSVSPVNREGFSVTTASCAVFRASRLAG